MTSRQGMSLWTLGSGTRPGQSGYRDRVQDRLPPTASGHHAYRLPPPAKPPAPTRDGTLVTVDQPEANDPAKQTEHVTTPSTSSRRVYHLRLDTEVLAAAAEKAQAEGMGVAELVNLLLRTYNESS